MTMSRPYPFRGNEIMCRSQVLTLGAIIPCLLTSFVGCASSDVSRVTLIRQPDATVLEVVRGRDLPMTYHFEWDSSSNYIDASELKKRTFHWDAGGKTASGDLTCRGYIRIINENQIEINLSGYEWSGEFRELEINGIHDLSKYTKKTR